MSSSTIVVNEADESTNDSSPPSKGNSRKSRELIAEGCSNKMDWHGNALRGSSMSPPFEEVLLYIASS
ncbi:hypothetical protein Tcan_02054 [Toxocara canis]|uniref:Uncharacterized protein n=1 Tax=Toxocara canis TaxID=6265 RepID=A0A0B2USE2_TOXCA|nr:hypothetical protein Tcan_02054 [Toxocara canis]